MSQATIENPDKSEGIYSPGNSWRHVESQRQGHFAAWMNPAFGDLRQIGRLMKPTFPYQGQATSYRLVSTVFNFDRYAFFPTAVPICCWRFYYHTDIGR